MLDKILSDENIQLAKKRVYAHLPQIKKAISKEKLTKRGLVSPLDYYLEKHALKLN